MAKEKQIQNRIQVIASTSKITQAMKMVSIAKLEQTKRKLATLAQSLAPLHKQLTYFLQTTSTKPQQHFFIPPLGRRSLYMVLTPDKGLCGTFINVLLRKVEEERYRRGACAEVSFAPIGKKGHDFFKAKQYPYIDNYVDLLQPLSYEAIQELHDHFFAAFAEGTYDSVMLIYQPRPQGKEAVTEQLLPFPPIQKRTKQPRDTTIYEPNKQHIMQYLIPRVSLLSFYQKILRGQLAEHTDRMFAMSQATDNANDLQKTLSLQYNRLRQATITRGIIEVSSAL